MTAAATEPRATLVSFEPLEPLLFRDPRPFNAGEQNRAKARLPDSGTLFGAVRSSALSMVCTDLSKFGRGASCDGCAGAGACPAAALAGPPGSAGAADHPGSLRIVGPFVIDRRHRTPEVFVPTPAVLRRAGAKGGTPSLVGPPPAPDGSRANGHAGLARPWRPLEDLERWPAWLPLSVACSVASGRWPSDLTLPGWCWADPYVSETRLGIARDADAGTALEQMLYRADFLRFEPGVEVAVIVLSTDDVALPATAFLGGKGRRALLATAEVVWPPVPEPAAAPGRYTVTLLTAGSFGAGWVPALPDGCTVAAAAVPPAVSGGGWDVAAGRPRAMRWLCPPGSVWWVDAASPEAAAELCSWHGTCRCEDRPAAGFGAVIVRRWEGD